MLWLASTTWSPCTTKSFVDQRNLHSQYSRTLLPLRCQQNGEPTTILSPSKMRWSRVAVSCCTASSSTCSSTNSVTFRSSHAHSRSHSSFSHPGTSLHLPPPTCPTSF